MNFFPTYSSLSTPSLLPRTAQLRCTCQQVLMLYSPPKHETEKQKAKTTHTAQMSYSQCPEFLHFSLGFPLDKFFLSDYSWDSNEKRTYTHIYQFISVSNK